MRHTSLRILLQSLDNFRAFARAPEISRQKMRRVPRLSDARLPSVTALRLRIA
jgi:hypothetical protein